MASSSGSNQERQPTLVTGTRDQALPSGCAGLLDSITSDSTTFATSWPPRMLDARVPIPISAARLCHARASTTLNVYAHAVPGGGSAGCRSPVARESPRGGHSWSRQRGIGPGFEVGIAPLVTNSNGAARVASVCSCGRALEGREVHQVVPSLNHPSQTAGTLASH